MWFCKIGDSSSIFTGMGIKIVSEMWFKSGKNIVVNIDSKIRSESLNWGWVHIYIQVQFHWSDNFPNCQ